MENNNPSWNYITNADYNLLPFSTFTNMLPSYYSISHTRHQFHDNGTSEDTSASYAHLHQDNSSRTSPPKIGKWTILA